MQVCGVFASQITWRLDLTLNTVGKFFEYWQLFSSICSSKALLHVLTHLKHCHATKFCCYNLKKCIEKKVDASSTCCNTLFQLATTKFCCVTMFEVVQQQNFVAWQCLEKCGYFHPAQKTSSWLLDLFKMQPTPTCTNYPIFGHNF